MVNVNKATAIYYYHRLQIIISQHLAQEAHEFLGAEIEVDESYFGGAGKGNREARILEADGEKAALDKLK